MEILFDECLLINIFSFVNVSDYRFTYQVCRFWRDVTKYKMRKVVVSPWMKTHFMFGDLVEKQESSTQIERVCVDSDRGIFVGFKESEHGNELIFSTFYDSVLQYKHNCGTDTKFQNVVRKVWRIPAKHTLENKTRYFICIRFYDNFNFIEFTSFPVKCYSFGTKEGDINASIWNYDLFWYRFFVDQFKLVDECKRLGNFDHGYCDFESRRGVRLGNGKSYLLYYESWYFRSVNLRTIIDRSFGKTFVFYARYFAAVYRDSFSFFDLWDGREDDSFEFQLKDANIHSFWEIDFPFVLVVKYQSKDMISGSESDFVFYLLNLIQNTFSRITFNLLFRYDALYKITKKHDTYLIESYNNPPQPVSRSYIKFE